MAIARSRPERVTTLVLIASGGPTPLAPPPSISKFPGKEFFLFRFGKIQKEKEKVLKHIVYNCIYSLLKASLIDQGIANIWSYIIAQCVSHLKLPACKVNV